jgi:hypothetical protein
MVMFRKGDLVEIDGLLAVVVGTGGAVGVPEDHVAVWFGEPRGKRLSEGGRGGLVPEVWTVPAEYCRPARAPEVKH